MLWTFGSPSTGGSWIAPVVFPGNPTGACPKPSRVRHRGHESGLSTMNNRGARHHRTCTTCIRLHRTSPRQASLGPACPGADGVWSSSNVHKGLSHANFHPYRDLRGAPRSVPSTARPSAGGPGLHFMSPLLFPALRLDIGSLIEPLVERFRRSRLRCPDFNRTVVHGGTLCSRLRVRFGC